MEQIGEVVELRGKKALVRIHRVSACGENCASCEGGCKPTASVTEAVNGIYAKVGDTVKIQMNSLSYMLLAFIGYILPLIVCIATYFLVKKFTDSTVIADASAIGSLVGVLVLFYIIDKLPFFKKSNVFSTRIIKIIRR
ncbi:MAG: SoxR reducing system RseC family protein [Clostridia bacterium]|nr:SoxR reducing system RseC family protein [Clostridia bacterium]